jgi:flavin reductase (DIM6/NTAB) family NADH-FMN oxidoreductase RutF
MKDTAQNILSTKEFVISLVSQDLAEAMNLSCIDAPPEVSELSLMDLAVAPSTGVSVPRIASSPVSLECSFLTSLSFGSNQVIVFGQVGRVHVSDGLVIDQENCIVDTLKLRLFGAMHAARFYSRTTDTFEMVRPTWAQWQGK